MKTPTLIFYWRKYSGEFLGASSENSFTRTGLTFHLPDSPHMSKADECDGTLLVETGIVKNGGPS